MKNLCIGILAHIDAGKTSTTEQLLFKGGVISQMGSVDAGNTQTDSLALEQSRGITIQSAVTAFTIDDTRINLVDTPGHPDFIAEVERVLEVLDGAILVISAIEGVQAQTRVLFRTLKRLRIPCIFFVNKIDRMGARYESLLEEIAGRLSANIVPLGKCHHIGLPEASWQSFAGAFPSEVRTELLEHLADHDDNLLEHYLNAGETIDDALISRSLATQTQQGKFNPVLFGSAITGTGFDALMDAIVEYLPLPKPDTQSPVSGFVFKIERGNANEKRCYAKIESGIIRNRDRLRVGDKDQRITGIELFDKGTSCLSKSAEAGRIAILSGLANAKIGDRIGEISTAPKQSHFSPPMLESVIRAKDPQKRGQLYTAMSQLAEQDPLIGLRIDERGGALHVSLYGEVQREVIEETLASQYNLDVEFSESNIIHIERPCGEGEALEVAPTPFIATIGLKVEPASIGDGNAFGQIFGRGLVPDAFINAVREAVDTTLKQGLYGWAVHNCRVTMTQVIRYRDWAISTAADHRKLAPLVLMEALRQAGTKVYEPIQNFYIECPENTVGNVITKITMLRAVAKEPQIRGSTCMLEGTIPASKIAEVQLMLPNLTHGEGFMDTSFSHYEAVIGEYPIRKRTDNNPLNRKEYLRLIN